jgi:hypothetical protein
MGEQGMVAAVVTSDNRLIVVTDGAITTWNAITMKRIRTIRGPRFTSFVNGAISPDGRTLGYGLDNGTVHFVNTATGRSVDAQGSFSPDGGTLYTASLDGTALQWDIAGGRRFGDTFPVGSAGTGGIGGTVPIAPCRCFRRRRCPRMAERSRHAAIPRRSACSRLRPSPASARSHSHPPA